MRDLYSNDVETAAYLAGLDDAGWPYDNDPPPKREYGPDSERIRTVSRPDETKPRNQQ